MKLSYKAIIKQLAYDYVEAYSKDEQAKERLLACYRLDCETGSDDVYNMLFDNSYLELVS